MMNKLSSEQCRVIGVMLEKEITTPDQYPLSLNGLTNGCNQKSNREPVTSLSESDVQNTLDDLAAMRLISEQSGFGSRVVKYKHRFCNTEYGNFRFTEQQLAIICVLLLRGPQTPGELRTRTNRLAEFDNVAEVESVLIGLQNYNDNELVVKLPREPGKRESRFAHMFAELDLQPSAPAAATASFDELDDSALSRIATLEQQVSDLTAQLAQLNQLVDELTQ